MTYDERIESFVPEHATDEDARRLRADKPILIELINVLTRHPGGLRRWSVMSAIRKSRENAAREIPQKFEDEIERTFRRFCADADNAKTRLCAAEDAFFYRPKDKAGEVWAVIPDRAKAWIDAAPVAPLKSSVCTD